MKSIKSAAGNCVFSLGLQRYVLNDKAVIVAFHRISDSESGRSLNCASSTFKSLCAFFRRHFDVVDLHDLIERVRDRRPIGMTLAITFDDGYKDNFEVAAPILEAHGLPATFFIATGFIGTSRVPFWDRDEAVESRWMDWGDVEALHRMGFDIGAHTVNHVDLGTVPVDEARREIAEGRAMLESRLDTRVRHFAYPFGGVRNIRSETVELVREAGFDCCLSCHGGVVSADDDVFSLMRDPINTWVESAHQYGFELLGTARSRSNGGERNEH